MTVILRIEKNELSGFVLKKPLIIFQIASLKAALARKEGEAEHTQSFIANNSERYKTKASPLSPLNPNQRIGDMLTVQNNCQQPMGGVESIEVLFTLFISLMSI